MTEKEKAMSRVENAIDTFAILAGDCCSSGYELTKFLETVVAMSVALLRGIYGNERTEAFLNAAISDRNNKIEIEEVTKH